ncbi:MAG: L-aspartate oxidase [Elusimicrobiota bacterium]
MEHRSDFLVVGSGIAGLLAAHKLSSIGTVHVVTKKDAVHSSTNHAQGGIAAVMEESDSFEDHVQDTLKAGAGLCAERIVRMVVGDGPARVRELMDLGVRFSGESGKLDLGLEGGHSHRRVLHAGDLTGREIERALVESCRRSPDIRIFENHSTVDLLLSEHPSKTPPRSNRCLGAYALENATGAVHAFTARATILATGGAGKVYMYTSNPDIASGDGMAMSYRAGAELRNLEFVQFHPTCLYDPGSMTEQGRRFLLSEALRGEGGVLLLKDGTRFMERYDPRKELAPRDVVARAIDAEMKRSGAECVYLDMSAKPKEFLEQRFPGILAHCRSIGLDMVSQPIPVVPAAHFFCGGVQTDPDGATDIPGLFAVGETAHTGLHGANRLASNSLLEGAIFAHRSFLRIRRDDQGPLSAPPARVAPWDPGEAIPSNEAVVVQQNWDSLRRLMWNYVGIVRSDRRLKNALERIRVTSRDVSDYYWQFLLTRDLIELRNIALLSELIVTCALSRRESRGLHFNTDCPGPVEAERHDSVVSRYLGGKLSLGKQEAARP